MFKYVFIPILLFTVVAIPTMCAVRPPDMHVLTSGNYIPKASASAAPAPRQISQRLPDGALIIAFDEPTTPPANFEEAERKNPIPAAAPAAPKLPRLRRTD